MNPRGGSRGVGETVLGVVSADVERAVVVPRARRRRSGARFGRTQLASAVRKGG
jgi:hypothetical protein